MEFLDKALMGIGMGMGQPCSQPKPRPSLATAPWPALAGLVGVLTTVTRI